MAVTPLPPPPQPVIADSHLEHRVPKVVTDVVHSAIEQAVDAFHRGDRDAVVVHLPAAQAKEPKATHVAVRAADLGRSWRQFRAVDPARLAALLPDRAKALAPVFVDAARDNGIDPLLLVAISKHETGTWTSRAFRHGNAMGVSGRHGARSFHSVERSIRLVAETLGDPAGPYRTADTIRDLWRIYAPSPKVGSRAVNDPRGLNRSWGPAIARQIGEYELLLGTPKP